MKKKEEIPIEEKPTVEELKKGNFIDAWVNAFNGIIYATTTQRNIKWQLVIAVVVMLVSLLFNLTRAEFLCLMFTVILIILAEMFNTAVETVVDLYTDLYHPKAKIAKDSRVQSGSAQSISLYKTHSNTKKSQASKQLLAWAKRIYKTILSNLFI